MALHFPSGCLYFLDAARSLTSLVSVFRGFIVEPRSLSFGHGALSKGVHFRISLRDRYSQHFFARPQATADSFRLVVVDLRRLSFYHSILYNAVRIALSLLLLSISAAYHFITAYCTIQSVFPVVARLLSSSFPNLLSAYSWPLDR